MLKCVYARRRGENLNTNYDYIIYYYIYIIICRLLITRYMDHTCKKY